MLRIARYRRTAPMAVFVQALEHRELMNERATIAPSGARAAGRDFIGNPIHPVLLAICGALISLLFAAHIGAAGPSIR